MGDTASLLANLGHAYIFSPRHQIRF